MEGKLQGFSCTITVLLLQAVCNPSFSEMVGFSIKSEQAGRCLQPLWPSSKGKLTLEECSPGSVLQQWQWLPHTQALSSLQTGECLGVLQGQRHEFVRLQSCTAGKSKGQTWSCSEKGHLALEGMGLYLSARNNSTKLYLTTEHGKGSKWVTITNHSICKEQVASYSGHLRDKTANSRSLPLVSPASSISMYKHKNKALAGVSHVASVEDGMATPKSQDLGDVSLATESYPSSTSQEPSMVFFTREYGMSWKVTMLVLSILALVLGFIVIILNIHYNKNKKVVSVLQSMAVDEASRQQASPVPSERSPLTRHSSRPSHTPPLQRGEIMIEWKDGTVTPLFDNINCLTE